jgi:hypothetical protein
MLTADWVSAAYCAMLSSLSENIDRSCRVSSQKESAGCTFKTRYTYLLGRQVRTFSPFTSSKA